MIPRFITAGIHAISLSSFFFEGVLFNLTTRCLIFPSLQLDILYDSVGYSGL